MGSDSRILITGSGAICAAGRTPLEIWETLQSGQSAIGPIGLWDTAGWPRRHAGEVRNLEPAKLLGDRKILKFIRRSDVFGLYAGGRAIEAAGIAAWRDGLDEDAGAQYSDRTGVYVGSGGGTYDGQYDYFPLMTSAAGNLVEFGRQLPDVVNPMWLLRALPNNVLCHIGIKYNLKGANACITNHSESGMLAVMEAAAGLRAGDTILNPFPLINIAAIGGMVMTWLVCQGRLVQHHPFDLPIFLRQMQDEEVAYTVAPPAVLNMLPMALDQASAMANRLAQRGQASRCRATSSRIPLSAVARRRVMSSSVKGSPSAVPCTSTKRPSPVCSDRPGRSSARRRWSMPKSALAARS